MVTSGELIGKSRRISSRTRPLEGTRGVRKDSRRPSLRIKHSRKVFGIGSASETQPEIQNQTTTTSNTVFENPATFSERNLVTSGTGGKPPSAEILSEEIDPGSSLILDLIHQAYKRHGARFFSKRDPHVSDIKKTDDGSYLLNFDNDSPHQLVGPDGQHKAIGTHMMEGGNASSSAMSYLQESLETDFDLEEISPGRTANDYRRLGLSEAQIAILSVGHNGPTWKITPKVKETEQPELLEKSDFRSMFAHRIKTLSTHVRLQEVVPLRGTEFHMWMLSSGELRQIEDMAHERTARGIFDSIGLQGSNFRDDDQTRFRERAIVDGGLIKVCSHHRQLQISLPVDSTHAQLRALYSLYRAHKNESLVWEIRGPEGQIIASPSEEIRKLASVSWRLMLQKLRKANMAS